MKSEESRIGLMFCADQKKPFNGAKGRYFPVAVPLEEAVQLLAFAEDRLLQPDVVSYSTVTWPPRWIQGGNFLLRTVRTI